MNCTYTFENGDIVHGVPELKAYLVDHPELAEAKAEEAPAQPHESSASASLNKPHVIDKKRVLTPAGAISADARNSKADSSVWYYQGDIHRLSFSASVTVNGQPDKFADEAKRIVAAVSAAQKAGWSLRNYRAGSLGTVWALEKGDEFLTRAGLENLGTEQIKDPGIPSYGAGYENMVRGQKEFASALFNWLKTLPADQRENRAVVSRKMEEVLGGWAYVESDKLGVRVRYRPTGAVNWTHTIPGAEDWNGVLQQIETLAGQTFDVQGSVKTEEPQAEPVAEQSVVQQHEATMEAARKGRLTLDEFKASSDRVLANKEAIVAELAKKTKAELLKEIAPHRRPRYNSETKPEIIDQLYIDIISSYALGKPISYTMEPGSYEASIRAAVKRTTDEQLAQYAKDYAEAVAARMERLEAYKQAITDPKTLDDFRNLLLAAIRSGKTRQEAFMTLTPEQRIRYDELEAESTRDARETRKRAVKPEVGAASQTTGGQIIATKHTRDGYDLFVVQLADRLSKEDYQTVLAGAKQLGGWYSSFKINGAIPGFQFKTREAADAFLKLAGGDTSDAKAQAEQRRDVFADDKSQTAAERLKEMADRLEGRADEELSRERKANTARRASMAASAEAAASADKALAKTMRNIAEAIGSGKAKFLDAVRQKTQVEMLAGYVRAAKDNELRAKYPNYGDQEKRKGQPPTAETADYAEFPSFTAFRSDLATLARQLVDVDGTKKIGQNLMKVADDVSDAYLAFAKENLLKVSQYGANGKLADFASKEDAELAIRRSNLVGKAIVLPVKRGQNRIILSPSEAIERKVWQGDSDKRLTLTRNFGMELVEAIGRRANKENRLSVPWQFETAATHLKALSRMGIETPAELRSALREFIGLQAQAKEADRVKMLERAMVGRAKDGLDFFPTSQAVVAQMIEAADIKPDMAVLEPSAGMGHIADAIRDAGAEPDVIELSNSRAELLEAKGYQIAGRDFLELNPRAVFTYGDVFRHKDGRTGILGSNGGFGSDRYRLYSLDGKDFDWVNRDDLEGIEKRGNASGYDRIIMNPPFSDRRDAEHVQHAYELLKPGGRIVAIMGEGVFFGNDKRAQEFRDWLESVGGTSEKLPEGSFLDPLLPVNTGVNARMVVIDKPQGAAMLSRAPLPETIEVDGKMRPTTNSKGQPIHPTEEGVRNFWKWFGDSRVVDAEGRPLVVYHGTNADFSAFKPNGALGGGMFFSPDPKEAAAFAYANGANVMPMYLAAKKVWPRIVPADDEARTFEKAKKAGYDAVRVRDASYSAVNFAVFSPAQVKSAAGNFGAFDPANPDIRYSAGNTSTRGTPIAELRALARQIQRSYANLPKVHVLASPADLPAEAAGLREEIARQGAENDVEGAMFDGAIYLFADNLASLERAEFVLAEHEVAHLGLRGVFGDNLEPVLRQIAVRNPKVREAARQAQSRGNLSLTAAVEEVLADIPTAELAKLKGWRKLVEVARDWFAGKGFERIAAKLDSLLQGSISEQEAADLYVAEVVKAARDWVKGGKGEAKSDRTGFDTNALPLSDSQRSDPLIRRFVNLAVATARAEKQSNPSDWTARERAAYARGDWREFSRLRGYTQAEIDQFGEYMEVSRQIEERDGEGAAQAIDRLVQDALETLASNPDIRLSRAGDVSSAGTKPTRLMPKWAAGVVTVNNAHRNLYGNVDATGEVFLRDDGLLSIDGNIVGPDDILYLIGDRFKKEIPAEFAEKILKQKASLIKNLTEISSQINRSVSKRSPSKPSAADSFDSLWGEDTSNAWQSARYPNARPGWSSDLSMYEFVDGISDHHDPEAIKQAVIQEEIDSHLKFKPGYLHLSDESDMTPRMINAIAQYRERGGRVGKTILDALGDKSYIKTYGLDPNEGTTLSEADQTNVTPIGKGKGPNKSTAQDISGADGIRLSRAPAALKSVAESINRDTPKSLKDWLKSQLVQHRPFALGFLTLDQIADIYKSTIKAAKTFADVVQAMETEKQRINGEADDLAQKWRKLPGDVADKLADVMHAATLAQFDPERFEGDAAKLDGQQRQILSDWNALNALNKDAKAIYVEARESHQATLKQIRDGLANRVLRASSKNVQIANQIRLDFDNYLKQGPYFPLARFGDFILISDNGKPGGRIVESFESVHERNKAKARHIRDGYKPSEIKETARKAYSSSKDGAAGAFAGEVLQRVQESDLDPEAKAKLMDELNQLAISTLPDASYRKHFSHRKGVPGFSKDAIRAYANSQFHAAHHIAKINHADQLSFLIDEIEIEARDAKPGNDVTEAIHVAGELRKRLDNILSPKTGPVAAALGQFGFMMSLGGNIASGVTNLTQTPLVTFPWLGSKYGFDKAASALQKASKDYLGGEWNKWSGYVMEKNPKLKPDERKALETLRERGKIDLTQTHDLAGIANQTDSVTRNSYISTQAMKIVGWTFHLPEVFNRQVTALAAYRLAREKLGHEAAVEYAAQTIDRTHFNYAGSNRARHMQGDFMRVLTMFKQYSQQMTYVLWRNAQQAIAGTGATPEETRQIRREARRMLGGVMAMHFMAAGSLGLPLGAFGISTILMPIIAALAGDEDDPFDWETEFRNLLADTFGTKGGEVIAHGPLRAILPWADFAGRVGLGDLWIRPPAQEMEGRDALEAWMQTLAGPTFGYLGNMATAGKLMSEGEFMRSIEAASPKMISGPLKALRFGTEGVKTMKGDDTGIELDALDIGFTALGWSPSDVAESFEERAAIKNREHLIDLRRQRLMNRWYQARKAGDFDELSSVMEEIDAFNAANEGDDWAQITPKKLAQSAKTKDRNAAQIKDGVYLSKNRESLRDTGRFADVGNDAQE